MNHIESRHFIYLFMALVCLGLIAISFSKMREKYKTEANQQRFLFKCFIASLAAYFFFGYWCGMYFFHFSPLTALINVVMFTQIPTYSLCFLGMAFIYMMAILGNAVFKIRQDPELKDPIPERKGIFKAIYSVKDFFERHPTLSFLFTYTFVFLLAFFCIFASNLRENLGFVWRTDGKAQYLPYMKYTADYLHRMFANLAHGNYTMQMYDFSIGFGEDVRAVVRIHPTEFLAVFFDKFQLDALYNFLAISRYYLAGLTFACYCRHRNISRRNSLVATFSYIFGANAIITVIRHPIFSAPMILLPLLLIAMDRLIEKKGYLLFSFLVALSLATSYYFLYMTTIALGFYALIRFAQTYRENKLKEFFAMMGRIIFFYLLGVGISSVFFLPTLLRTLTSDRVGTVKTMVANLYKYSDNQGLKIFASTITGKYCIYDVRTGFAAIFLPALAVLFFRRLREHWGLKLMVILEFIVMYFPIGGIAMSAFSTLTNRWIYIAAMTGAYIIAVTLDDLMNPNFLQLIAIIVTTVLYTLTVLFLYPNSRMYLDLQISLVILIVTVVVLLFIKASHYVTKNQFTAAMILLSIISLTAHSCYIYDGPIDPLKEEFLPVETEAHDFFDKQEFARLARIEDNSFYRNDVATERDYYENMPVVFDYNGTSIYNSIINANIVKHLADVDTNGISAVHRIYNLDGRSALEALNCVKYFEVEAGNNLGIPYNFVRNKELSDDEFWIYENRNPMSIGYSYQKIMDQKDYDKLSALDKEQAMMKAVIVDSKESGIKANTHTVKTRKILEKTPKISKLSESLNTEKNYFELIKSQHNLGFMMSFKERVPGIAPAFSVTYQRKKGYEVYIKLEDCSTNLKRAKIIMSNDRFEKNLILRDPNDTYSLGRDDYYISLGYCQGKGKETIRFSFADRGDYSLKNIKICYVPMKSFKKDLALLQRDQLENVVIDTNTVSGTVSAKQNEIMVFSIPYSKGWTASMDGKDVKLFKANTAYLGMELPAGNHSISLRYETPGLKLGALISLLSVILSIVIAIIGGLLAISKKFPGKESY